MDIIWHGKNVFSVKSNGVTTLFNADPNAKNLKGDIIISTTESKDNTEENEGEVKIVNWPGEYEIQGMAITAGLIPETDHLFITLNTGKIKLCMIESCGKKLDEDFIDRIGDVDVLVIGIDGEGMDAEKAHTVIEEVEPRCVIPMNYEDPTKFLKTVGASNLKPVDKYTIKARNELIPDTTEYVVLQPQEK